MKCRHCGAELTLSFIDLGSAPLSNSYLSEQALHEPEAWYPLRVMVCTNCWLVQAEDYADRTARFSPDYSYFSSFSTTWLQHSERFVAAISERLALCGASRVVEIGSNDGYLLQYVKSRGIPCLGVEPTASTAQESRRKGIDVVEEFFGVELALQLVAAGWSADLVVANNVLAHVPDINDFVAGVRLLLKAHGVASFEFPHLLRLVQGSQFDTIYHEHYSYLSLIAVRRIFERNELVVFDVEELPTHGGSLRVLAQRSDGQTRECNSRVGEMVELETAAGVTEAGFYAGFQAQANRVKNGILSFLLDVTKSGSTVAAYGAAAKGNTLLNYAGVRQDLIRFVVDRNPAKQGKYMPGSRIPIVAEAALQAVKPDYVVILPWNLRAEVLTQLSYASNWGCRFVVAIPEVILCQGVAG